MIKYYYKLIGYIENFLNVLIVFFLNLKYCFRKNTPFERPDKCERLCLLGNGPSLRQDFDLINQEKKNGAKIMAVNLSILTDYFLEVQPDYYILQDPAFFRTDVEQKFLEMQKQIVAAFLRHVNWELKLILPPLAKKNEGLLQRLSDNKFIKIYYRKTIPIIGGTTHFNNFLFRKRLATPLAQNVLIGGLFEALQMGFKKILIFGADHSWHENYSLGNDNVLYTIDKHFYDKEAILKTAHIDEYGVPVRVHDEFLNLYRTFKIYDILANYAQSISADIINNSSKTWIDSFNRPD